jgi:hypothetical protein
MEQQPTLCARYNPLGDTKTPTLLLTAKEDQLSI